MDEIFSNLFPIRKEIREKEEKIEDSAKKNEKNPIFFEWEHCFFQKNWL